MDECKVVKLIRTTLLRKGSGEEGYPIRIITQYWTMNGQIVFEFDAIKNPEPMNLNL